MALLLPFSCCCDLKIVFKQSNSSLFITDLLQCMTYFLVRKMAMRASADLEMAALLADVFSFQI